MTPANLVRCGWAGTDPLMVAYHDDEWGTPTHDDTNLFELPTLEGAQASIVRHRGKIESTISNARAVLSVRDEFGSFDAYVGAFVDGVPIVSEHMTLARLPASTDEARALAKDLKRRGFRFVGPTTVYAFMQAAGLNDDHVVTCFRRATA